MTMLKTESIIKEFGKPGEQKNIARVQFPYPMRIAWDTKVTVTSSFCHKDLVGAFRAVFDDILAHYGLEEIQRLGIDLFGGILNVRKMRGGTDWSRHSWGIAIDLDPARNGLRTKRPFAQFSKPEYKPMIDIFYKHGFISYGVERNYDWMHFEFGGSLMDIKKKRYEDWLKGFVFPLTSSGQADGYEIGVVDFAEDFNDGMRVAYEKALDEFRKVFG